MMSIEYATAQSAKIIEDIKANAIPVSTDPDDSIDFKDLQPLKQILNGKRIVGMGEATHGSHEFFAMKHRMLEFLVKQMGFRVFAIEANFTECRAINDYVLYGKGDVKKLIAGIYTWAWNTQEVLKMIEWIRSYNQGKNTSDKVKFYGFDMQFDQVAAPLVASRLKQFDSIYYKLHFKALDNLSIYRVSGYEKIGFTQYSQSQADSIELLLKNIITYITAQDVHLLSMFSREEVDYLIRDVRLLDQCLEEDKGSTEQHITVKGRIARDKCMTENVEWILDHEGPNSKIVLWAHNGHMNKLSTWMGGYLKISLKDQYYALGFDFNKGGFRAKDLKDHKITNFTVGDAGNGSTGEFFSQLEMPAFFTDIAGAVKGDNSRRLFFTQKMPSRTIGAAFDPQDIKSYYTDQSLYAQFDGLIFINETTPTVGIQ